MPWGADNLGLLGLINRRRMCEELLEQNFPYLRPTLECDRRFRWHHLRVSVGLGWGSGGVAGRGDAALDGREVPETTGNYRIWRIFRAARQERGRQKQPWGDPNCPLGGACFIDAPAGLVANDLGAGAQVKGRHGLPRLAGTRLAHSVHRCGRRGIIGQGFWQSLSRTPWFVAPPGGLAPYQRGDFDCADCFRDSGRRTESCSRGASPCKPTSRIADGALEAALKTPGAVAPRPLPDWLWGEDWLRPPSLPWRLGQ